MMKSLFLTVDSFYKLATNKNYTSQQIASAIKAHCPINRMGGFCFVWAIAIHRVFGGDIIVAVNDPVFNASDQERLLGHAAVKINSILFDSEGITDQDSLESWGMLDPQDSEYVEEYNFDPKEWADTLSYQVGIYQMNESELAERLPANLIAKIPNIIICLRQALNTVDE